MCPARMRSAVSSRHRRGCAERRRRWPCGLLGVEHELQHLRPPRPASRGRSRRPGRRVPSPRGPEDRIPRTATGTRSRTRCRTALRARPARPIQKPRVRRQSERSSVPSELFLMRCRIPRKDEYWSRLFRQERPGVEKRDEVLVRALRRGGQDDGASLELERRSERSLIGRWHAVRADAERDDVDLALRNVEEPYEIRPRVLGRRNDSVRPSC